MWCGCVSTLDSLYHELWFIPCLALLGSRILPAITRSDIDKDLNQNFPCVGFSSLPSHVLYMCRYTPLTGVESISISIHCAKGKVVTSFIYFQSSLTCAADDTHLYAHNIPTYVIQWRYTVLRLMASYVP